MNTPSRLQQALAAVGHGIIEEWKPAPKPDRAAIEEMTRPAPTWAEVQAESRRNQKEKLTTELQEAEVAAVRAKEMLPHAEAAYAKALKEDRAEEALLRPDDYTRRLNGLRDHIGRLKQAIALPDRVRRRLAFLEQQVTHEQKQLAAVWNAADRDTRAWFLREVADFRQFDEQALAKNISVEV